MSAGLETAESSRAHGVEPVPAIKPYRVLSLDGGGMRGIYTAEFLERLTCYFARTRKEEALDLGKGFDLITGTSTGAIVACALAIGKPMSEVVDLYREHGPSIFPHRISGMLSALFRAFFLGAWVVRLGDVALRKALIDVLEGRTTLVSPDLIPEGQPSGRQAVGGGGRGACGQPCKLDSGGFGAPPWGHYDPCARSSLERSHRITPSSHAGRRDNPMRGTGA